MAAYQRKTNNRKRRAKYPNKVCRQCAALFNRHKTAKGQVESPEDYIKRKYCSHRCFCQANQGANHWYWKGGIKEGNPDGYLRDSKTDKLLHRLIMERHLGRELTPEENIHHIDGNKRNNDISNLQIMTNSEHRKLECASQKRDREGKFCK